MEGKNKEVQQGCRMKATVGEGHMIEIQDVRVQLCAR